MTTKAAPIRFMNSNHSNYAIPNNPDEAKIVIQKAVNSDPHGSLYFPPIPNARMPEPLHCVGRSDIPNFMEKVHLFYDTLYRELYPELAQIVLF